MDLRKCILKKTQTVLSETSFGNISNISIYESAADDTDNSIYYSLVNESAAKSVDAPLLDVSTDTDLSNGSRGSDVDKENTIIERETGIRITIQGPTPERGISEKPNASETECVSPQFKEGYREAFSETTKTEEDESQQVNKDQTCKPVLIESNPEEKGEAVVAHETDETGIIGDPPILSREDAMIVDRETISPMPEVEIAIMDVNDGKINPFTSVEVLSALEKMSPIVEKRPIRRSSILIQSKARFYSPVLRKSLERKAKAVTKPALNSRRTLYEAPTRSAPPKPTGKTPTRIPKPALKAPLKPKALKCPASGCNHEFATAKALVDHQKTHKPTTASQAFPCRWCDKKFQLETALFNHQTENCTKIPVVEKRKILAQQDKKEKIRRRTTIFAAPVSMKKSPRKQKRVESMNKSGTLNKSGIAITPKKSLKCHICKQVIPDALGLANHIMGHKFEKQKQNAEKETA